MRIASIVESNRIGLRFVSTWCRRAGLHMNPDKTVIVPFTRKHKLVCPRTVRLHGREVKRETKVNFFGVPLDQKLFWKTQAGNIKNTRDLMISENNTLDIYFNGKANDYL